MWFSDLKLRVWEPGKGCKMGSFVNMIRVIKLRGMILAGHLAGRGWMRNA
jgi:hypothetical protein